MKNLILIAMCAFLSAVTAVPSVAGEMVTTQSLLREMTDRDSVARYPQHEFRLKQASSYNRASKTPDDPKGWFDNFDRSTNDTHKNFVRVENRDGNKEWVVMDHEGAGAVTRFWVPWPNQLKPETDMVIRFYLDGASEPAIEGNMFELFQGKGMVPFPLAHESLRSAVSFFPIPYAKRCKVTMSDHPFFFQFTYREYAEGTPVETFTMKDFRAAKPLTESTCKSLLNPNAQAGSVVKEDRKPSKVSKSAATLKANQEMNLTLPSGAAAIRELSVKLNSYANPEVTRLVVLKISFDGKPTVWCPIGDFFGCGIGLNPFQGWYRTVAEDGTMTSRWVMPYQENAAVSIVNLGKEPIEVNVSANVSEWKWDDRSLYFHAAWRGQYPVPTRPYSDWNYVTLKGRGVYVGDTLTIMNPVKRWWGEGDEKIFVDGETFPSIFGTGTEDYYAYSWGGRSTDFYEHPFHAQPFSNKYNKLNRKTENVKNAQGYSTETRTRALDTMPFAQSLQLDMEVWSWTDCDMGYGVGTYWYGDAATTSSRKPDPAEVLNVPPLPDMNAPEPAVNTAPKTTSKTKDLKGAVECEKMEVVSKSGNVVLKPQNLRKMKLKGSWNRNTHVLFKNAQVGDVVQLRIPSASPAAQKLVLHATKSYDFGILRLSVNGKPVGTDVDLYAAKPVPSEPMELGTCDPVDNGYVLRVELIGKNPQSKAAFFGLDCVTLSQVE